MAKQRWKRTLSLVLSAAMVWSMSGVSALAEDLNTPASNLPEESVMVQDTNLHQNPVKEDCICDPKVEGETGHTNKDCPFYQEENTDEKVCICDPKVEGETGHTNKDCPFYQEENTDEKVCICDPKVEGETGHTNKDCPFYQEENTDEKVCICDPKVEGETGHTNKDCPFYQEENTDEIEEAKALIEKLPSLEEINQWKPTLELTEEDEGYQEAYDAAISAHREELRKQIQESRAAYDALDEEQKKAFDQGLLSKLTSLETKLSQPVIDMESRLSALPSVEEFQNWKPVLDIPENDPGYQAAYDAAVAAHRKEVEEQVNAVREAYDILTSEQQAVLDPDLVEKFTALEAVLLPALMSVADPKAVYVSNTGSDEDNQSNGSKETPYASLAKAVDKVENGGTIYVMSDLTSTACARIVDKNITITSGDSGPYIISRGAGFETISDNARSWYNPAMIEVTTPNGQGASLTLSNIILDDVGKYEGTIFAQATGTDDTRYVQDAIVAAYGLDTATASIILEQGAVLKNFGGMSAVRVTGGAELTMRSGSKICDDTVTDRVKDTEGGNGPAGAVWVQGGTVAMHGKSEISDESKISNIVGRALYVDGGSAKIGGTIHDITGDNDMWEGKNGAAILVRGVSNVVSNSTAVITDINSAWNAVWVIGGKYEMQQDSRIENCGQGVIGISLYGQNPAEVFMNGTITGINHANALNINVDAQDGAGLKCTIGSYGKIWNNIVNSGAIYIQGSNSTLTVQGEISNNISTFATAGIWMANNYLGHTVTLKDGAKIINNKSLSSEDASAVIVSCGTFNMEGGLISGNTSENNGGGITVRRGGTFVMSGGIIEKNSANGMGGGILFDTENWGRAPKETIPRVILEKGIIQNNINGKGTDAQITVTNKGFGFINRYMTISKDMVIGNPKVYLDKYGITLDRPAEGVKFGNASPDVVRALTQASAHKDWSENELASLWYYSSKPTTFILSKPANVDSNRPVYVAVTETGVDGKLSPEGKVTFYSVIEENGNWKVNLPASATNGSAIALVQPTNNYGSLKLAAPEEFYRASNSQEDCNIPYTATYQLSENLKNQLDKLSNVKFVFDVDSELKIDPAKVSVSGNGFNKTNATYSNGKLTIDCTVNLAAANSAGLTDIKWIGVLSGESFENGKVLEAKGELTAQLATRESTNISVPSNLVTTRLLYADQFTITATAGTGGSISPSGDVTVMQGKDQTFTITPNSGYVIDDVKVDGISKGAVPTYTFTEVQDNHIIEATFRLAGTTPEPEDPDHPGSGENNDTNNTNNTNTSDEDSRVPHINLENIKDKDVPLEDLPENNLPEDDTTIDDGEVPLKPVPNTGDMIPVAAMAAAALSLGGVIVLSRKRK